MLPNPQQFAKEWIDSWNSHDMKRILSHYGDNFSITTPMIKRLFGNEEGTLYGKEAIKKYWEDALQKVPDLHFELLDITLGVTSIALFYKSVFDTRAMEVMFFNDEGKVEKVIAHYSL